MRTFANGLLALTASAPAVALASATPLTFWPAFLLACGGWVLLALGGFLVEDARAEGGAEGFGRRCEIAGLLLHVGLCATGLWLAHAAELGGDHDFVTAVSGMGAMGALSWLTVLSLPEPHPDGGAFDRLRLWTRVVGADNVFAVPLFLVGLLSFGLLALQGGLEVRLWLGGTACSAAGLVMALLAARLGADRRRGEGWWSEQLALLLAAVGCALALGAPGVPPLVGLCFAGGAATALWLFVRGLFHGGREAG